jgi:hypothetical protein
MKEEMCSIIKKKSERSSIYIKAVEHKSGIFIGDKFKKKKTTRWENKKKLNSL